MDSRCYYTKKNYLDGGTSLFLPKNVSKKPKTLEYAQVLVVTWVKLDCAKALLSPPPLPIGLNSAFLALRTPSQMPWDLS